MPKICGVYFFDGKDATIEVLASGLTSLNIPGVQTFPKCEGKNVALGQLDQTGQNGPKQLQKGDDSEFGIVADAKITNRTELLSKFGASAFGVESPTDLELILRSYLKWGDECPEHIVGDFAFAIWDSRSKSLFCARDHLGGSTFFFSKSESGFFFASEPKAIHILMNNEPELNKEKLGIFLLKEPHTYLTHESWYKGIEALPAGTSISINPKGIRTRRYWKPAPVVSHPFKSERELLEAFRELFFEVVDTRIGDGSDTACLLSGGLDSSSIVAAAATVLAEKNLGLNVFAGVLSDPCDPEYTDEREYIDEFRKIPNIKINYCSAKGKGPFSDLSEFFENYDSPFITSRHYLYSDFLQSADAIGATTLFEGVFGEMGPTSHGEGGFAEMFVRFKWIRLLSELRLRSALYGDSLAYNIRANVINPLLPEFLIKLRHRNRQRETDQTPVHPLNEDFAQSLLESTDSAARADGRDSYDHRVNQLSAIQFTQEKMSDFVSPNFGGSPVELRYPFLDKRLMEFSLAAPIDLKIRDGYNRYLIRAALDKVLPPKIQWRTTKEPFSPDYMRRFNRQLPRVREFLQEIDSTDPVCDLLDLDRIRKWADVSVVNSERYTKKEEIARDRLPQAIYLIQFLRKFRQFKI